MRTAPFALTTSALCALASPALARCRVLPGTQGELSTWMLSGPYAAPVVRGPSGVDVGAMLASVPARLGAAESALAPTLGALWRPFAASSAYLDVGASLGGRGPRVAYAALALDVSQTADRWLFLGADDAVTVLLDGREVFRSAYARASREDDDAIALHLAQGPHTLVIKLATQGDMDLFARFTDSAFRPDPTVHFALPGVDDAGCNDLARRATVIHAERSVATDGTRLDAQISFPGGSASVDGERVRSVQLAPVGLPPVATELAVGDAPIAEQTASTLLARSFTGTVTVTVGAASAPVTVAVDARAAEAILRARRVLTPLDGAFMAAPSQFPVAPPRASGALTPQVIWSVERTAEHLAELLSDGDNDAPFIASETALLNTLLDGVEAGRDPYTAMRGALRRAYRSPLDGTLQEFSLYVPASYRGESFPLVMTLHGLHGSAHRMLPVMFGIYDEGESRTHAERHIPTLPDAPAIVVAPYGHGDAGYRHQGEYDPMRVLDEVRASYRIDSTRTYMTGLSMGGIGAASLPLHHPDVFAAAAPLCGYHSYLIRGDTQGVRRPWEMFLMEMRSNASWAENGLHLPMYIVQGTLDRPLTNSLVLSDRYTALHYTLQTEWPTLGHNVWSTTYAGGRIFPYFMRFRRNETPRTIRFRTPDLRWRQSDWLAFDRIERRARWAEAEATLEPSGALRVSTQNLTALTLSPPRAMVDRAVTELAITIDHDVVRAPLSASVSLVREGGHWSVGARPAVSAHGPIREVEDSPLLFVYGAGDAAEARLNERVARSWAHRPGVRVSYPVVRDDSYTEAMGVGRTLVLVGSPRANRLLARMMPRLPVQVTDDAVTIGATRYQGPELGVVFATHDPDDPQRAVVVISGPTAFGAWRSRSLPDLLPDYVVFDRAVAPARGRVLLGARATVLAAGYLNDDGTTAGWASDPAATRR